MSKLPSIVYILYWWRNDPHGDGGWHTLIGVYTTAKAAMDWSNHCTGALGKWHYMKYDGVRQWFRKSHFPGPDTYHTIEEIGLHE
jgi:hypothetical protein